MGQKPQFDSVMTEKRISNIIGFDDAPFNRESKCPVSIVGAVYANMRLDGVLIGKVERDGQDATDVLSALVGHSKFLEHTQLIMLQGIALAGFNVVDAIGLNDRLGLPVLVVSRRFPNMKAIRDALVSRIANGHKKWALIERLGPMEPVNRVYVQRVGISIAQAADIISRFSIYSHIPEPIRTAHLIAGALVHGVSKGNP